MSLLVNKAIDTEEDNAADQVCRYVDDAATECISNVVLNRLLNGQFISNENDRKQEETHEANRNNQHRLTGLRVRIPKEAEGRDLADRDDVCTLVQALWIACENKGEDDAADDSEGLHIDS